VADKGEVRFIGEVESGGETSTVLIYPEYCPGLLGVQGYSHLIVLYWMHGTGGPSRLDRPGTRGRPSRECSPAEAPQGPTPWA
jgi:tRNA (Thr-GGU) A37 N-methylase